MPKTKSREFVDDILNGDYDDSLDVISATLRERRKVIRKGRDLTVLASVKAGDKGRLDGLSPKYLNGEEVEVVAKKESRISVKLIETNPRMSRAAGRFGALPFTIPAGCFIKAE